MQSLGIINKSDESVPKNGKEGISGRRSESGEEMAGFGKLYSQRGDRVREGVEVLLEIARQYLRAGDQFIHCVRGVEKNYLNKPQKFLGEESETITQSNDTIQPKARHIVEKMS